MLIPKTRKVRDRAWLDFVRDLPCAFCFAEPPSEPSHIRLMGSGGMGLKTSDSRALPACRKCHSRIHSHGERSFYGVCVEDYIALAENIYAAWPNKELCRWLLMVRT